jgi:hypothetical protein
MPMWLEVTATRPSPTARTSSLPSLVRTMISPGVMRVSIGM